MLAAKRVVPVWIIVSVFSVLAFFLGRWSAGFTVESRLYTSSQRFASSDSTGHGSHGGFRNDTAILLAQHITHSDLVPVPVNHVKLSPNDPTIIKRVILKKQVIPNLNQLALGTFPFGSRVELHTHQDMSEIFHILSGTATFELHYPVPMPHLKLGPHPRSTPVTKHLQAGDTIAIPPGVAHAVYITPAVSVSNDTPQSATQMLYFAVKA